MHQTGQDLLDRKPRSGPENNSNEHGSIFRRGRSLPRWSPTHPGWDSYSLQDDQVVVARDAAEHCDQSAPQAGRTASFAWRPGGPGPHVGRLRAKRPKRHRHQVLAQADLKIAQARAASSHDGKNRPQRPSCPSLGQALQHQAWPAGARKRLSKLWAFYPVNEWVSRSL